MECSNSGGAEDKRIEELIQRNVSRRGSNGGCMVRALLDHTHHKKLWRGRIVRFRLG